MSSKKKLPHRIIPLPNADKGFHESVTKLDKDKGDFAHPIRLIACGPPNSGKTTLIANLLLHQTPPFERVVVWHCDPDSQEWSHVTDEIIPDCPNIENFDPETKNALIIDDVAVKSLNKKDRHTLDRLCGYASTHRNISIFITGQQPSHFPASIRRQCSVFCLWRSTDMQSLRDISTKCGIMASDLKQLLSFLETPKDSLCIDLTGSKYKYRRNIFEVIEEC